MIPESRRTDRKKAIIALLAALLTAVFAHGVLGQTRPRAVPASEKGQAWTSDSLALWTASAHAIQVIGHIGGTAQAVTVHGRRLYVGEGPRLSILDIAEPERPRLLGKTALLPGMIRLSQ